MQMKWFVTVGEKSAANADDCFFEVERSMVVPVNSLGNTGTGVDG